MEGDLLVSHFLLCPACVAACGGWGFRVYDEPFAAVSFVWAADPTKGFSNRLANSLVRKRHFAALAGQS